MHLMIKSHGVKQTLIQEAPTGIAALAIAELFYKFHSFLLEGLAFLATWYALSVGAQILIKVFSKEKKTSPQPHH